MSGELVMSRTPLGVTQAAEGLMRRRWRGSEIEEMVKAGIIDEDERFELIGGEIVPMSSKGIHHEVMKNQLMMYWAQQCPPDIRFAIETTFHMSEDTFLEPDIVFFRLSDGGLRTLKPETALLAVEVADSSLSWDRGRKARLYASFGVPEVWVINAVKRETTCFLSPGPEGYRNRTDVPGGDVLTPYFALEPAVSLEDLAAI